jgi:hypothetical protein
LFLQHFSSVPPQLFSLLQNESHILQILFFLNKLVFQIIPFFIFQFATLSS